MYYPLRKFSDIPGDIITMMEECMHIEGDKELNTDDLLSIAATPKMRQDLERYFEQKNLKLPEGKLTQWAGMADLVRVKGIGPAYAQQLVLHGNIGNIQELINTLAIPNDHTDEELTGLEALMMVGKNIYICLVKIINRVVKRDHIAAKSMTHLPPKRITQEVETLDRAKSLSTMLKKVSDSPFGQAMDVRKLTEAVEEALELRPRLVLRETNDTNQFQGLLSLRKKRITKNSLSTTGLYFGLWAILMGFAALMLYFTEKKYISTIASRSDWSVQLRNLKLLQLKYANQEMVVMIGLLILWLLISYFVILLTSNFIGKIPGWIFKTKADRNVYQRILETPTKGVQLAKWAPLGLSFFLSILFYLFINKQDELEHQVGGIVVQASVFGFLIGLLISIPTMWKFLKYIRLNWDRDRYGFLRYMIYQFLDMFINLVVLILSIGVVGSFFINIYSNYFQDIFTPNFRLNATAICQERNTLEAEISEIQPISPVEVQSSKDCMAQVEIMNSQLYIITTKDINNLVKWVVNTTIIWVGLASLSMLFLLPYLAVSGWWRGAFYVGLLLLTDWLEGNKGYFIDTLSLDSSSKRTSVLIFFFVFLTALIFDWLYDTITERKKTCPNCDHQLNHKDQYCSTCGFIQP
jgi:hypothetical protein